jgi:hypothetical protein
MPHFNGEVWWPDHWTYELNNFDRKHPIYFVNSYQGLGSLVILIKSFFWFKNIINSIIDMEFS